MRKEDEEEDVSRGETRRRRRTALNLIGEGKGLVRRGYVTGVRGLGEAMKREARVKATDGKCTPV